MTVRKPPAALAAKLGRPRSFDREAALHSAMLVFWAYGYETSSVAQLTAAMGITAPSLYAAFGDKRELFLEAMRRYAGDPAVLAATIDQAPTSRAAISDLLHSAACAYTGEGTPRGCLLASAVASCSGASADVQSEVAAFRLALTGQLARRIGRDVAEGVLPPGTDAEGLAGLSMAVGQGMSVLARDGASRAELLAIVAAALGAWPGATDAEHRPGALPGRDVVGQ